MRKFYKTENFNLDDRNNDPPLALREALPDKNAPTYSDEEDPLETNLRVLDVEFATGLESSLEWIFGDCLSENIPTVDLLPSAHIPNLKNLSCAEVMDKFHPISLYHQFAEQSNGYFYRWQHGNNDADDEEEAELYKVPIYDLNWKDRTVGSMVQQFGLQLAQARRPRARIADYWRTDSRGPLTPDNYRLLFEK